MKKLIGILIALGVLIGIMLITCPDEERHVNKVTKEIVESARNAAEGDETGIVSGIVSGILDNTIISSISESVAKIYVNDKLKVSDYGILNVGKMKIDGEEHVVSIGMFNHVFTTSNIDKIIGDIDF